MDSHKFRTMLALAVTSSMFAAPLAALSDDRYKEDERRNDASEKQESMHREQVSRLSQEDQNDIKEVLVSVIENAVNGDVEDVVDYFAEDDRNRLENQQTPNRTALKQSSESFNAAWEKRQGDSFADLLDVASLDLEILSAVPEKNARVRVRNGSTESIELTLVNQGAMMDAWRIDVPSGLTIQQLQHDIQKALSDSTRIHDNRAVSVGVLSALGISNGKAVNRG